ncbi:ParA family protein [Bifidobacterium xylocopae]|uniref:Chromosome partitioning protein ParA n=1 Tax=Bifidobacterium xylocopae TaxID=2493119 RepID=A0A366KB24_9BIFI|nr:ParA family protein [Bifidobacterium xylocopae]RBP98799.1 chromosome partitioning protein ParA [Bifidobacterium xylocopae]
MEETVLRGPIIAFGNTKGGVGKTTSTILTACSLNRLGYCVEVRDIDPSAQATAWAQNAQDAGTPLPFPVIPANMRSVGSRPANEETWILIDTPPLQTELIDAAVNACDLAVLVTTPGKLDMMRMLETSRALNKPSSILLTQVREGTVMARQAKSFLKERGMATFDTIIPMRESLRQASCTGEIPSASGYGLVATELISVFNPETAGA